MSGTEGLSARIKAAHRLLSSKLLSLSASIALAGMTTAGLKVWIFESIPKEALWWLIALLATLCLFLLTRLAYLVLENIFVMDVSAGCLINRLTGKRHCPTCQQDRWEASALKIEGDGWRCMLCNKRYSVYNAPRSEDPPKRPWMT